LASLEDPASELNRLWDRQHDTFIVRRLLELIEPEFTASTWQAFWRQVIDGQPPGEVADALGLSLDAVYTAKSRVLRRLRRETEGLTD
jgi:RNA polymerase sigma-70 factor, ECF subfamily